MIRQVCYLGLVLVSEIFWLFSRMAEVVKAYSIALYCADRGLALRWLGIWKCRHGQEAKVQFAQDMKSAIRCGLSKKRPLGSEEEKF